jgi:hypothetical protein
MLEPNSRTNAFRPRAISRRDFLSLAASAAAAGLLTGCNPATQPPPTQTSAPTTAPTDTAIPLATDTPEPVPSITEGPVPTATKEPTATPEIVTEFRRPEIISFYPDAPSKVVHTHHAGVWKDDELAPGAIRQMLDASITGLTGLGDARAAWAALFAPDERIAIKVNAFRNSIIWTHVPLVMAVVESLQEAGVPAEQIVIFDYYTNELEEAGFPVNKDGPGVRCYGTDSACTEGWKANNTNVKLSNILLGCDALINMPILKSHMIAGLSFALKNHFGTVSRPDSLHMNIGQTTAALNALPPIKDRTRLIVGDVLTACLRYSNSFPYWDSDFTGDSILVSFDPVAHDTVGLQLFGQLLTDDGGDPSAAIRWMTSTLVSGAELGLGTDDPENIDLVEVNLG